MQIKTLTDGFYPFMYYRYYENLESVDSLEFPPAGPNNFWGSERWDKNYKLMTYQRDF